MKFISSLARSALLLGMCAGASFAQSYPTKPIRIVIPFPPGGTTDIVARAFGQKMTDSWRQPVIVDSRAGAGGNIAADAVAKAPPDGYTVLMSMDGLAISAGLYRKLPFDPVKDLAPVSQLTSSGQALVVNANLPVKSVKELVVLAKAQPGKLNFGSGGFGAPNHLYAELLKKAAGIDIVHVPYKGEPARSAALLSGEVHIAFGLFLGVLPHIKAGKVRLLAVTTGRRLAAIPDVPTMIESGVPDFDFGGWLGIFAPAGTPREVVLQLNSEASRILALADFRERLPGLGYEPVGGTPEEFAARFKSDVATYAKIIKDANVPLVD